MCITPQKQQAADFFCLDWVIKGFRLGFASYHFFPLQFLTKPFLCFSPLKPFDANLHQTTSAPNLHLLESKDMIEMFFFIAGNIFMNQGVEK